MIDWIKKNKVWLTALGAGVAGGVAALGYEMPDWLTSLWKFLMSLAV